MYEIMIKSDFSGAHKLRGYKGKCEDLHGHNWKVEARFEGSLLNDIGIAADFKALKSRLRAVIKRLDHSYLNRLDPFKKNNPSAENISRHIFKRLKASVKDRGISVKSVSVWESETSCAAYYE